LYTRHEFFITSTKAFVSPDRASAYTRIRHGDVLFAASGETTDDIGRSAVNLLDGEAVCGGDIIVLRPTRKIIDRFLGYAADAPASRYQKATMGRGFTVVHIYGSELKRLALAIPPLNEQAAIARFLDHANRQISRYIRAKQKLLKLLEEEKQAIVHRAVTRGLDPNVRLKTSGAEWLGQIPMHWNVRKLRHCVSIEGGMTPSMEAGRFWNGTIPWVTPKDMKRAAIDGSSVRVTEAAIQETALRLINPPAILMVVRGMILARRVPIARTTVPVTVNQDMKALKPHHGINIEFLTFLLQSAQGAFTPLIDEAGHGTRRLPTERWRNIAVVVPAKEEQTAIVRFIEERTRTLLGAIERAGREIELLGEFRARLIADVATGKLDVREAAARLPQEAQKVEPLDEMEDLSQDESTAEDIELEAEEAA
jgi:type I restriction enzyme S subunit